MHGSPRVPASLATAPAATTPVATAEAFVQEVAAISASTEPRDQRLGQLRGALQRFVTGARVPSPETWRNTTGRYTRVLLNAPEDPFQIIVVFWPPGSRSAVHDHDETLGAVMPLFGELLERKYAVEERPGSEDLELRLARTEALRPLAFSPITEEPGWQLHDMVNASYEWAATVHVYLRRIDRFRVFAQRPTGSWRALPKALWFDYGEGWRRWDAPQQPDEEHTVDLAGQGSCLCGETRFRFEAAPAAQIICHCTDCQRSTGSAMAPLAFFPASSLRRLSGQTRRYAHRNDSGHVVCKEFCACCGTTLFHTSSSAPHLAAVLVGVLDDARGFRPTTEIYVGSAPHWARLAAEPESPRLLSPAPARPEGPAAPIPTASEGPGHVAASAA